jgi:hypothetical protein
MLNSLSIRDSQQIARALTQHLAENAESLDLFNLAIALQNSLETDEGQALVAALLEVEEDTGLRGWIDNALDHPESEDY